jgi:hypothetical protein
LNNFKPIHEPQKMEHSPRKGKGKVWAKVRQGQHLVERLLIGNELSLPL